MSGFLGFLSLILTGYLGFRAYGAFGGEDAVQFYILAGFASFWFLITSVLYLLGHIARIQAMVGAQLVQMAQVAGLAAEPEFQADPATFHDDILHTSPEPLTPQVSQQVAHHSDKGDAQAFNNRVRKVSRRTVKRSDDHSVQDFAAQDPNNLFKN